LFLTSYIRLYSHIQDSKKLVTLTFQASPGIVQKINKLENEVATLDCTGGVCYINSSNHYCFPVWLTHFIVQADLAAYHKLLLGISELEKKIMSEMIKPQRVYLTLGRLVGTSFSCQC
jgi:ATP-dependent RNA helicase DOB1